MSRSFTVTALAALAASGGVAAPSTTGGTVPSGGTTASQQAPPAVPTPIRPLVVKRAIRAANRISGLPYRYGGGHASFNDTAYDCSGSVSYVLHAAGLLTAPLDSTGLMTWGLPGPGRWITVYANPGHAWIEIGGRRFDTSGSGGSGPRWRSAKRASDGFVARHPAGL
jgi:hypothetical protein